MSTIELLDDCCFEPIEVRVVLAVAKVLIIFGNVVAREHFDEMRRSDSGTERGLEGPADLSYLVKELNHVSVRTLDVKETT